jgi:coenzyme F420-reducing hydrogenase beta subunit
MKKVCEGFACTGCMACAAICPNQAIEIVDRIRSYEAIIQEEKCVHCNACLKVCQNYTYNTFCKPIKWYQGWANDPTIREQGSSGGLATAIASAFIESGGVVFSCMYRNGSFIFDFADNVQKLIAFSGSKYIKSNPMDAYPIIKDRLLNKQKILYIGLPCQVAGMKNYLGQELSDNLYTIDLICHGTPSPILLKKALAQYGMNSDRIERIQFRIKDNFGLKVNDEDICGKAVKDYYTITFLEGLTYTDNCYICNFANKERISDITLGDSWGSTLPLKEWKKGISLILCQTEKGQALLDMSNVHLEYVDLDMAIKSNEQLSFPSTKPKQRNFFFVGIQKGSKFNQMAFLCYPKQCIKQTLKKILLLISPVLFNK